MKFKEFIKKNLTYIIAFILNLAIIGFLFAPLLSYRTRIYVGEDKIDTYFKVNIIKLFDGKITEPWLGVLFVCLIGIILLLLIFAYIFQNHKKVHDVLVTVGLIFIAVDVCFLFLNKEIFTSFAYELVENFKDASIAWGTAVSIFLLAIEFMCFISLSSFSSQSVRGIAEDAILIAAAFVLNLITFFRSPTGGSVNLQMLPLMIIALRRGPLTGFICGGFIYGLLTCISDGYGFATYPFDYLLGFGSVAILGFFKPLILSKDESKYSTWKSLLFIFVGGLLSTLVRYIGSTTSSVVIYHLPLWSSTSIDALEYNLLYVLVSGGIAIAGLMLLFPAIRAIEKRYPVK